MGNNIGLAPLYRIGSRSDVGGRTGAKSGEIFLVGRRNAEGGGQTSDWGKVRGSFFWVGRKGGRRTKREVKTSFYGRPKNIEYQSSVLVSKTNILNLK